MTNKKDKLVEIARSFSYKLNLGNYQTADFFCSQKAEVSEEEAEKKSELLYQFCREEVMKSIKKYLSEVEDATKEWDEKQQNLYNEKSEGEDIEINLKVDSPSTIKI